MPVNATVCKRHRHGRQIGKTLSPKKYPEPAPEASTVFATSSEGSQAATPRGATIYGRVRDS